MRMCLSALILMLGSLSWGQESSFITPDREKPELSTEIGLTTRYIYNVFYDYERNVSDEAVNVTPKFQGHTKPSSIYFNGGLKGLYEKYFSNSIQNHFDYEAAGAAIINEGGNQAIILSGKYGAFSDPSPNETYGRINHTAIESNLEGKFKGDRGNSFVVAGHIKMEKITVPPPYAGFNPDYLTNNSLDGKIQYSNAFLPETVWFLRASGGATEYVNPTLDDTLKARWSAKNNSLYGLGEIGVVGRLTEKSTLDCASGFLARLYKGTNAFADPVSDSFTAPVFYLRFTEQITRRDQLIAGYNYVVKDSYWTDYSLDQEIYIGLARVVGDQILLLGRTAYTYRSFSLPQRRDDQRIAGAFTVNYSLSPTIKLTADVKVDLLASDAYDNGVSVASSSANPDRPASYRAGSFGLGIMADF